MNIYQLAQKPKAQEEPEPATEIETKPRAKPKANSKSSNASTKKSKEPPVTTRLDYGDEPCPVDAMFHGQTTQAALNKHGDYVHTLKLKLTAPFAFTLQRTVSRASHATFAVAANILSSDYPYYRRTCRFASYPSPPSKTFPLPPAAGRSSKPRLQGILRAKRHS